MHKLLKDKLEAIYGTTDLSDAKMKSLVTAIDEMLKDVDDELRTNKLLIDHFATECKTLKHVLLKNDHTGESALFIEPTQHDKEIINFPRYQQLSSALEEQEFELYYQPQIDLRSGVISGVEALIRWNHPELGTLSPSEFIPVAEKTGLIIPIGEWVLRTACKQLFEFNKRGYRDLSVAINLSGRQFSLSNISAVIFENMKEFSVNPKKLEIEITESYFIDDIHSAVNELNKIRDMGVQISIDDFGTGYSSLSYLAKIPLDTLKIDQSFVRELPNNSDYVAVTKAIISIAHNLGLSVIAEGVETKSQCQFLIDNLCDQAQGFYFSRPIVIAELYDLLHKEPSLHSMIEINASLKQSLLFVDDEANNIEALKRIFRNNNLNIFSAKNGFDALKIFETVKIDVVVSDYRMPGMSGVELLVEVKHKYPNTKRIILTGQADLHTMKSAINDGAVYQFLTKPWNDDHLKITVLEALKNIALEERNKSLADEMTIANRDMIRLNRELTHLIANGKIVK